MGVSREELTSFRSHEISSRDGTKNNDISINTFISHYTNGAARIECSVCLRNLIVETSFTDLGDENVIGSASDLDFLGSYFTEDSNSDPGW